jgi:hypothetical protein
VLARCVTAAALTFALALRLDGSRGRPVSADKPRGFASLDDAMRELSWRREAESTSSLVFTHPCKEGSILPRFIPR